MAASGVQATPECFEAYQSLKRSQYKYIVFKLSDDKKSIVVDAKVEKDSAKDPEGNYTAFTAALPEQDCRWVVYDFDYTKEDESTKMLMQKNKIIFLSWSPDNSPIRAKMTYASSKDSLRKSLEGIGSDVQGTDFAEVAYSEILSKVSR